MPRMSDQLKIELDGSALETNAKRVESALNELRGAIASLSNTPMEKIKADLGKVGTAMAEVTRAVGNDLKGMREAMREGVKKSSDAAVEETDRGTARLLVAQRNGYLKMRDARIRAQAQAIADDRQFYSQVRQLRVQAQADAAKAAIAAEAARFGGLLGGLKNASKSMWAERSAQEKAGAEAHENLLGVLNARIKSAHAARAAELDSALATIGRQSKSMWTEKAAREKADAAAYLNQLDVINAQVKAAQARNAASLAQQMSSAANRSRALVNQAMQGSGGGAYSSISGGAGYGTLVAPNKEAAAAVQAATGLSAYTREAAKAQNAARGLTGDFIRHAGAANDLHSAYRGLASGVGALWLTWGNAIPLMAGAAVSNAFVQAIKIGAAVEQSLTKVYALGGETAGSVNRLNAVLLETARSGPYGPLAVAEALKTLSLAGLTAEQQMKALKPVMNFAVAGDIDMTAAAETLVAVGTAYGYTAQNLSVVGDMIAQTAASSMASVQDMSEAFKQASVVAQQYGVTLEDTSLSLAMLAQIGIKGSAAGTAMRNMYTELMGTSKKAREVLDKTLGVDVWDKQANAMKPIVQIMGELSAALDKYDSKSQQKILMDLGNERGTKALAANLAALRTEAESSGKAVSNMFLQMQENLRDAPGFTALASAQMAQTTQNQFKSVIATLQAQLVAAFQTVQPAVQSLALSLKDALNSPEFVSGLNNIVSGIASLLSTLVQITPVVYELGKAYLVLKAAQLGVAAALGTAAAWGAAATAMTAIRTAATGGAAALVVMRSALALLPGVTAAAAASMTALQASMGFIGLILSAGAAAWVLYKNTQEEAVKPGEAFRTSVDSTIEALLQEEKRLDANIAARRSNTNALDVDAKNRARILQDEIRDKLRAALISAQADRAETLAVRAKILSGGRGPTGELSAVRQQALKDNDEALRISMESIQGLVARAGEADEAVGRVFRKAQQDAREAAAEASKSRTQSYGSQEYTQSDNEHAKMIKAARDNELQQIEKQYSTRMSLLEKLESNEQTRLNDLRSAGAIREGEFMARELQATIARETAQIEAIEAFTARYQVAYDKQYEARVDLFNRNHALNAGKKGYDEDAELERLLQDLENLEQARGSFMDKTAADKEKVSDSAFTRLSKQAAATAGAIQNTRDAADEFWRAEDRALAKIARQTSVEDALRYATPESAARISAVAAETERLSDRVDDYDETLRQMTESLQTYVAAVGDDANWTAELTAKYWDLKKALEAVRAERDRVAGKIPEMAGDAGERAVMRFRKDEEAKLINGVADAITTGLFEGGKAGKKKLRDLLVAELRKPITLVVQAVAQVLVGGLQSLVGAGAQALGGSGSVLSTLSNGSSLLSAGSKGSAALAGFSNGLTAWAPGGSVGTVLTNPGMYSASEMLGAAAPFLAGGFAAYGMGQKYGAAGGTLAGMGVGALSAGGASMMAGGSFMSGAGALMSNPWGWAAMAALAILGADDSGTIHAGGAAQYNSALGEARTSTEAGAFGLGFGSVDRNENTISNVSGLAQSLAEGLSSTATAFGKTAGYEVATAFADDTSKDGAWGALRISRNGSDLVNWQDTQTSRWAPKEFSDGEKGLKQYSAAIAADTLQVLRDMDLPSWATDLLDSLGDAPTMEDLSTTVGYINGVQAALSEMGRVMPQLSNMTGETVSSLIQLFGGIEGLSSSLGSYYQEFYTDSERAAAVTSKVSEALGDLGLGMPTTRDGFRALVEAQDLTTDSGRETYAALIKLAPAFASVTEASRSAAEIASERAGLEKQLLQAQGDTNALRLLELKALDASNRALQMQIWAIEDQEAAAQQAEQAAAAARAALEDLWNDAFDALSRAVEAQRDLAQEQLDALRKVYDLARTNANELFGFSGNAGMSVAQANAFISDAAGAAQGTGYMPDADMLDEAIKVMRGQIDPNNYTNKAAYELDRLRTANNLQLIADAAEPQMTALEQQLEYLSQTLETAKAQLDALTGINTATTSVAAALAAWDAARATTQAPSSSGSSNGATGNFVVGGGGGGSSLTQIGSSTGSLFGGQAGIDMGRYDTSAYVSQNNNGYTYTALVGNESYTAYSQTGYSDASYATNNPDVVAYYQANKDIIGSLGQATSLDDYLNYHFATYGIAEGRKFASGGYHSGGVRMVGEFGPEVEVTGPAMYYSASRTRSMLSGGGDDVDAYLIAQLIEENRAMRGTLEKVEARLAAIDRSTKRSSEILDDSSRGKRPLSTATP